MERNARPRRRFEAPSVEPSTLHEIARRYVGCAVQLAKALGMPYTEAFLVQHRESVSCLFIEASKTGLRLPAGVTLPPLAPAQNCAPEPAEASVSAAIADEPAQNCAPEPEPDRDPLPPGEGEADVPDFLPPVLTVAPLPTSIPADLKLPCGGALIADLRPAQLALLVGKTAARVHAEGERWVPLLGALQAERAKRMHHGTRRNGEG